MTVGVFADLLDRHLPMAYRIARPPWRLLQRLLGRPSYWEDRRDFNYYREVIRLATIHAPSGGQAIDVGANETQVLRQLSWFSRRVALDMRPFHRQPGIELITTDFMKYEPGSQFDLVLCLQVLEHLDEPAPFARKLLSIGRTVIITVPFQWPKGLVPSHVQDPVDETKLEQWTQRKPVETAIVADQGKQRLIAVYR